MSVTESPTLRILPTTQAAADECAAYILKTLAQTLESQERATLAISGGSSPKLLFSVMAKAAFDWSKVHFFWVDERCVPPTDTQSNFRLANEAWRRAVNNRGQSALQNPGEVCLILNMREMTDVADHFKRRTRDQLKQAFALLE